MALLTKLARAGPVNWRLAEGIPIKVYESIVNLAGGAAFKTPLEALRPHLYSDAPAADDWIDWGDAQFVRLRVESDQNSAANGAKIQYTVDGTTAVTLNQASVAANTPYNSGWIARLGVAFRVVYTNGATPTTSFHALADAMVPVSTDEIP